MDKGKGVARPFVDVPSRRTKTQPQPTKRPLPESPGKKEGSSKRARRGTKGQKEISEETALPGLDLGGVVVHEGDVIDPEMVPTAKGAVRSFETRREV